MEALKTILYFSIFRYPLCLEEIHSYTNYDTIVSTENELNKLVAEKIINKVDDFYIYANDLESIPKRLKGNRHAQKALLKAKQKAAFIAKFPYVKAVGVSGSLSKGYYDNESDIDFLVITSYDKLWICRSLLMLYKKIFLLNSRKHFCINYFISENLLEIEEKNRFTATELKTLIPMQGTAIFEKFYENNKWVSDIFSKHKPDLNTIANIKKPYFTNIIEAIFNYNIGSFLDNSLKKITLKKWKSKFHYMNDEELKIALKSTKNISKHHPSNFQKKVMLSFNKKVEEIEHNFNITLQKEYV